MNDDSYPLYYKRPAGPYKCVQVTESLVRDHVRKGAKIAPLPPGVKCVGAKMTDAKGIDLTRAQLISNTCSGIQRGEIGFWAVECAREGWHLWPDVDFRPTFSAVTDHAPEQPMFAVSLGDLHRGTHGFYNDKGKDSDDMLALMASDLQLAHEHIAHLRQILDDRAEPRDF